MIKPSHADALAAFDWADALADLGWTDNGPVDLAWTMVDRHAAGPAAPRTAIHWIGRDGEERRISFSELASESRRVANLLRRLGIGKGDRIAGILPRIPQTVPIIIGCLRAGAIYVPVFGGFAPEAVRYRIAHSSARLAFVGDAYRHLLPDDPDLRRIVIGDAGPDDIDYGPAIAAESDQCPAMRVARSDPAFIIYTSGSTGQPKGCVIAANILSAMWPYVRHSLDLRPDADVFWPTGDPSWGYGLCCYLPALAAGATVISVEANASASVCLDIISRCGVTNFATNPTVLRGLMAEGKTIAEAGATIRAISCCGEPLNGEVVTFFQRVWGCTPMDHFGATEFGLPIGNHNAFNMAVKPGSMGLPAPGQRIGIVDEAGRQAPDGQVGLIGQRTDANTQYWLRYWNDEAATAALYHGDWVCTGDLARCDDDGYFWFEGRSDDIIKSSGYRIGPFEIESALLQYPGVTEAAAIGVPDPIRGEAVRAFVVMRPAPSDPERTIDDLVALVKSTCGRHVYPREIVFIDSLPKTQTGKIQRFLLRNASLKGNAKP